MDKVRMILSVVVVILLVISVRNCRRPTVRDVFEQVDTVVVRDTVRDTITVPRKVYVARIDTCWLHAAADTVYVSDTVRVFVPIERKEYATEEYRAVVEGWHPALVEMEVYPKTKTVTQYMTRETVRKTRWGIGVQAGYGISDRGMSPYIGLGINYNILTW